MIRITNQLSTLIFNALWPILKWIKPHYIQRVESHLNKAKLSPKLTVKSTYFKLWQHFWISIYFHFRPHRLNFHFAPPLLWQEFKNHRGPRCAFGIHFGPFELAYCALAQQCPNDVIWVMAKTQKPMWLNSILLKIRKKPNIIFFPPEKLNHVLPQILRSHGILAILIDQSPQKDHLWTWFEQPTRVTLKVVSWMQNQGAFTLPFAIQYKNGFIATAFEPSNDNWEKSFEDLIRQNPQDFVWHYPHFWK